jgi:hypothetical protein|nr:MAG TPA: hypothetical protein [Caudoviricetes sp.]
MMLVWESRVIRLHRTSLVTDNERGCWAPREDRVRRLRRWGRLIAFENGKITRLGCRGRVEVEVEVAYPDRRRRNSSRLAPTAAAIVNGLVEVRLLGDESDVVLDGPHVVVADRITKEKADGLLPMYEVRVRVYAEESRDERAARVRAVES